MKRQETSKPQYQIRPTFWIHADGDAEAEQRLAHVQSFLQLAISQMLERDETGYALRVAPFLYDDFTFESGHLIMSGWPDGEERVIR